MNASLTSMLRQLTLVLLLAAIPPFFAMPCTALAAGGQRVTAAETAAPAAAPAKAATVKHAKAHSNPLSWAKLKDFLWRTVNFIALLIILVKFLGGPTVRYMNERRERIAHELDDLTTKRDEAEKAYREFSTKLAGMEKDMERVIEQAMAQAQTEKARILAEAEQMAEDIRHQAQAAVQGEIESAKRRLREDVAEAAAKMAEELLRNNLSEADQNSIAEQYLERVGAAL